MVLPLDFRTPLALKGLNIPICVSCGSKVAGDRFVSSTHLIRAAWRFCLSVLIKTGDDRFYDVYIPIADRLYDDYLDEIRREGLIK